LRTNATINSTLPGLFSCPLFINETGNYTVSVWLNYKHTDNQILSNSTIQVFSMTHFLNPPDENYFEPCFGTPSGGTQMFIFNFQKNVTNVTFVSPARNYTFPCEMINTNLGCVSPAISTNDLTLYSSSKLEFIDKQPVSTEFIFYGKISHVIL
jgi:hypothetical protein